MEIEFMLKKLSVILIALCLSACSQNVELSDPAPQKMKVQTVDKKSQKGSATVYLCKGNKEVSVVHTKQKQKSKKRSRRLETQLAVQGNKPYVCDTSGMFNSYS